MRLTKQQEKLYGEACSLLSLGRTLSHDERCFVFDNWLPSAEGLVTGEAAYFTPTDLAITMAYDSIDKGRLLDLGAGIGALAYCASECGFGEKLDLVCVEREPRFVEVGRKLLPEATWIQGDIFSEDLWRDLGRFDSVISNPPFGQTNTTADLSWLSFQRKSAAHLMAIEVALKVANGATFLLPQMDLPFEYSFYGKSAGRKNDSFYMKPEYRLTTAWKAFTKAMPVSIWPSNFTVEWAIDLWQGTAPKVDICSIERKRE